MKTMVDNLLRFLQALPQEMKQKLIQVQEPKKNLHGKDTENQVKEGKLGSKTTVKSLQAGSKNTGNKGGFMGSKAKGKKEKKKAKKAKKPLIPK